MTRNHEEVRSDAWQKTLEVLTKQYEGGLATIEVIGLDLGDQFEAEQIPFSYIEYDPHDDAVSVGVGGLDGRYPATLRHVIAQPRSLFFHPSETGSATIEVRSSEGTVTLIALEPRSELAV